MNETAIPTTSSSHRTPQDFPERLPDYAIYKPNSRGSGGVLRFGLNRQKAAVFIEAAPQSGERQFDWDQKIIMKWGFADLGAALAVIQGRTQEAKLFHKSENSNSAFELIRRDDPERAPYSMSISRQNAEDKSVRKVRIPISHADAAVLETVLKTAIIRILGW